MNETAAIEALLFAAGEPITKERISELLEIDLQKVSELLKKFEGELEGCGIILREVAGGFQLSARPEFYPIVEKMNETAARKISAPMLETLSIVAYLQPVTRADIEEIRGVNVDGMVAKLVELNLIKEVGRKQVLGRPLLYGTTEKFLQTVGIKSLDELPELPEQDENL